MTWVGHGIYNWLFVLDWEDGLGRWMDGLGCAGCMEIMYLIP